MDTKCRSNYLSPAKAQMVILIFAIAVLTGCPSSSDKKPSDSAKKMQESRPVDLLVSAQNDWRADKLNARLMNNLAAALLRAAIFLDNASPEEISKITYLDDPRIPKDLRGRRLALVFAADQYLYAIRYNVLLEDPLGQTGKQLTNRTRAVLEAVEKNTQNLQQVRRGIDSNDFSGINIITVE